MLDEKDMSAILCDTLIDLAENDDRIVVLVADALTVTGVDRFRQRFPERVLNVGIAEANMIGVAAGMSTCGKIPIVSSFAPFVTRRCFDQIVISAAYSSLTLKIVGLNPGITTESNGGTHMCVEDVGIMRTIPGITIVEPVDSEQLRQMLPIIMDKPGLDYVRLFKGRAHKVYNDAYPFVLGKGNVLSEGNDVVVFTSGIMTKYVMDAAEKLREGGIKAKVVNLHTIKPLDAELVISCAKATGAVVTVENHSIIGGLGSAVAECLSESFPVIMKRLGIRDHFGEVGTMPYLMQEYKFAVDDIVMAVKELIKTKLRAEAII